MEEGGWTSGWGREEGPQGCVWECQEEGRQVEGRGWVEDPQWGVGECQEECQEAEDGTVVWMRVAGRSQESQ